MNSEKFAACEVLLQFKSCAVTVHGATGGQVVLRYAGGGGAGEGGHGGEEGGVTPGHGVGERVEVRS